MPYWQPTFSGDAEESLDLFFDDCEAVVSANGLDRFKEEQREKYDRLECSVIRHGLRGNAKLAIRSWSLRVLRNPAALKEALRDRFPYS
ncbi:hypothetical protein N7532_007573 [Penicillium argentinense]|uniref:Uncharacterized protein n=1 Tax=Penicillium argentinense TaxID=1131581 RepID=A0A9W9K7R8_9EURO|nr:uncharacterized protein N7532_007573 [Penicillium argentinense]KAJ5095282.1 hypothetical protein N7532_007573 [Penicillium argentinense]